MAFRGFASIALTAALVISHPLRGQGGLESSAAAISSSTPLHLSVVATGPAEGLQRADVHLLDNGTPATIQSFQPLNAQKQPAHVILVIDDVNARLTTVAYERDQLKKYFARNEGKLSVPLSLAVMTDQTTQIQPGFSQSGTQENDALQKYEIGLHEIRRDAQYGGFDRTSIGIRALTQLVQYAARIPGHKLILFVSPGWPLLSGPRVYLTNKEQNGILAQVAQLQDVMLRADIT
ncbi:MAG: hypothetical protein INR71_10395, partial [Terriglobus roseus]|nr:hypothetical protein [Terriglobus roseus]